MNKSIVFGLIILLMVIPVYSLEFDKTVFFATCDNDGTCDSGEDKCTCSGDCGVCSGNVIGEVCQEYSCLTGLCRAQIKYYCCGNHICESGEDFANCDADCAPTEITVELLSPNESASFLRGDEITFKARVKADGVPAKQANVRVKTFAGDIPLFDDGNHSDDKANDGIYGLSFLVSELTAKDKYVSEIYAEKLGVSETYNFIVDINPVLSMDFALDKNIFVLGEIINLNGQLLKRGNPVSTVITFSAFNKGEKVFESKVNSDKNGLFSIEQRTSLIYPEGNWQLRVFGLDNFGNEGILEKTVVVSKEAGTIFMDVDFSSGNQTLYSRGQEIRILADVSFFGEPIEDADVRALLPDGKQINFKMVSEGKYSLSYFLPFDFPLGEQKILVNARKSIGNINYGGSNEMIITVDRAKINVILLEPTKQTAVLGEELNFRLKLSYDNGSPLIKPKISIKLNDKNITAVEKEQGIFYFSYVVKNEDLSEAKQLLLQVEAEDSFGNTVSYNRLFEVSGEITLEYYFRENPLLFLSVIFSFIFIIVVIIVIRKRMDRLSSLNKRKKELEKLKSDLQEKYFNLGSMGNEQYYSLLSQYSTELRDIESAIEAFKKDPTKGIENMDEAEEGDVFGQKKDLFDDRELGSMFKVKKSSNIQDFDEEIPGLFSFPKKGKKLKTVVEKEEEKKESKEKEESEEKQKEEKKKKKNTEEDDLWDD